MKAAVKPETPNGDQGTLPPAGPSFSAPPLSLGGVESKKGQFLATVPLLYRKLITKAIGGEHLSARQHIRAKCLECSNFQRAEVTHCTVWRCPLHVVRPYQGQK